MSRKYRKAGVRKNDRAHQKDQIMAAKLQAKMKVTGLSAKTLLARGLTSQRQVGALQRMLARYRSEAIQEAVKASKEAAPAEG